jgi:hypothetical protein
MIENLAINHHLTSIYFVEMQSSKDRFYIYPKEKLSMSGEQGNFSRRDFIKTAGAAFSALPTEMKAKGLVLTSKNPDFLIAADIVTKEKQRITKWGYPYYDSYRTYDGSWTLDYYQYEEGTFILDFLEPISKNLIWRGAAKVALDYANTPEKRDKLIKKAIQKILQNYPPPSE